MNNGAGCYSPTSTLTSTQLATNQVCRGIVLRVANEAAPMGASVEVIKAVLAQHGYAVNKETVLRILHYLMGKNLLRLDGAENKMLGIRRTIAHITPHGVDVLEGTATVDGIELSV